MSRGAFTPAQAISVPSLTALNTITLSDVPVGTVATLLSTGATYVIGTAGTWAAIGGGDGSITVTADTGLTGDGSSGTPLAGIPATSSVPGTMSATDKSRADLSWTTRFKAGTTLPDADVTIQPFNDKANLYTLPLLTANRTLILGNANYFSGVTYLYGLRILRTDLSAFTYTIKKTDTTTITTLLASPGQAFIFIAYCSASGIWAPSDFFYVNG